MMNRAMKILFVDDEKPFRDGCQRLLTRRGFHVVTAENGLAALAILKQEQPDLMLLDVKMPVMGGDEIQEWVSTHYPDLPIIIITGHGTVHTAVDCLKRGADDFIAKPFEIEQLIRTIDRVAEKRRLQQKESESKREMVRTLLDFNTERKRLKTIINCLANGIMVTNRNLEVILHNPALMRMMEISEDMPCPVPAPRIVHSELLLKTIEEVVNGACPEDRIISQEIRAGKNTLRAITSPTLGPDRNVFWTVDGAVTVLEDITPFKELDQMKSDFVNMVAHELRSPIVSIRQLLSVLLEGLAGQLHEKQREFLNRGTKKADALLELINDLLDVAKIEAGRYVQEQVPTDIGKIIEETVALMEPRAIKQGIRLSCTFQNLKPVQADPKNMQEIFNNLISNAINYSPQGGTVTIAARGRGGYMEITVEDTGVGIPAEELPKIFDKFYRVKHPKTRAVTGTGLGLAIVKGVVEAHHGTIEVESVLDKGTTFRILLPVIP
jgi:two-component system, OmpR family, phosphate regulon sensor histidine kinase PhoR